MAEAESYSDSGSDSDHTAAAAPITVHADGRVTIEDDKDPDMLSDDELLDGMRSMVEASLAHIPRPPPIAYEIPKELYVKAWKQRDELTDDERRLLLSRGDLVGKALAYPEMLTPEEQNTVLGRPPPDVVRAAIERATGGTLHTPQELYAKAGDEVHQRATPGGLSDEELALMMMNFPADVFAAGASSSSLLRRHEPGDDEATNLLAYRESGSDPAIIPYVASLWVMGASNRIRNRALLARQTQRQSIMSNISPQLMNLFGPSSGGMASHTSGLSLLSPAPPPLIQAPQHELDDSEELDIIASNMEETQRRRDKGELTHEAFMKQNWAQIASLRSYARRKKSHRSHPYRHTIPQHFGMQPQGRPSISPDINVSSTTPVVPNVMFGSNISIGNALHTNTGYFLPRLSVLSKPHTCSNTALYTCARIGRSITTSTQSPRQVDPRYYGRANMAGPGWLTDQDANGVLFRRLEREDGGGRYRR